MTGNGENFDNKSGIEKQQENGNELDKTLKDFKNPEKVKDKLNKPDTLKKVEKLYKEDPNALSAIKSSKEKKKYPGKTMDGFMTINNSAENKDYQPQNII